MQLTLVVDFRNEFVADSTMGHLNLRISEVRFSGGAPGGRRNCSHLLISLQNEGVMRRLIALYVEQGEAIPRPFSLFLKQRRAAIE